MVSKTACASAKPYASEHWQVYATVGGGQLPALLPWLHEGPPLPGGSSAGLEFFMLPPLAWCPQLGGMYAGHL